MLTAFQIRTARAALNLSVRELSEITGVHPRTMNRMETWENDFDVPGCRPINLKVLAQFFRSKGIIFSDDGMGIRLDKALFAQYRAEYVPKREEEDALAEA